MSAPAFPLAAFLTRLGLAAPPAPDLQGLRALHRAHLFALAFENVEPFLGRPVPLGEEALAEKLLRRGRGGYCFELNSFFRAALGALGFEAQPVLGRVFMGRPVGGPRTHLATLVHVEGRTWLADVGFGGPGLVEPVPFEPGFEGTQHGRRIRLRRSEEWGLLYEDEFAGAWRTIYALPNESFLPVDVTMGNHYCATHPDSIFRQSLYCARPSAEGRVTVLNRSVHIHQGGDLTERTLRTRDDLRWLFHEALGLRLGEDDLEGIERRLPPA